MHAGVRDDQVKPDAGNPHVRFEEGGGRRLACTSATLPDKNSEVAVSLTIIVRDEEKNLPACLSSVAGLFDEIVVVDTGSKDRTREIAQEFGARVFDFVWIDDFAAARNAAARVAPHPAFGPTPQAGFPPLPAGEGSKAPTLRK